MIKQKFKKVLNEYKKAIATILTVYLIVAFFSIFGTLGNSLLYCIFNWDEILKIEQKLYLEFDNITHPAAAQQTKLDIIRKTGKFLSLYARYEYGMIDSEVERYYEIELAKKGWGKISAKNVSGNNPHRFLTYKKSMYELSINIYENLWSISVNDLNYPVNTKFISSIKSGENQ